MEGKRVPVPRAAAPGGRARPVPAWRQDTCPGLLGLGQELQPPWEGKCSEIRGHWHLYQRATPSHHSRRQSLVPGAQGTGGKRQPGLRTLLSSEHLTQVETETRPGSQEGFASASGPVAFGLRFSLRLGEAAKASKKVPRTQIPAATQCPNSLQAVLA